MYNRRDLAMRDMAAAVLMGAISGSDFGAEEGSPGEESTFAGDGFFGWDAPGGDFGSDFGNDWSGGFGVDGFFGADAGPVATPTAVPRPTPQAAMALWHHTAQKNAVQAKRRALLNPNQGVSDKVERYVLSISQTFTLGTATALNMTKQPDTQFRAQRVLCNVTSPVLANFTEIKFANVAITQGDAVDAFFFNANGWGVQLDLPTLSPANRVTALGNTTTLVPPGFVNGASYPINVAFMGPASVVA